MARAPHGYSSDKLQICRLNGDAQHESCLFLNTFGKLFAFAGKQNTEIFLSTSGFIWLTTDTVYMQLRLTQRCCLSHALLYKIVRREHANERAAILRTLLSQIYIDELL